MAKVTGGLHGRPAGNVAGVVYGAARTRTGKAVTARELVYPSNPQTADQVLQRNKFKESLTACRNMSASWWQEFFNRAIGQLPGFQSMMSIMLDNTNDSEEFTPPPDTPLGDLHFPDTYTVVTGAGASSTIDITWSTENGTNGTSADKLHFVLISKAAQPSKNRVAVDFSSTDTRTDGTKTYTCPAADEDYVVGCFLEGVGTAAGLLTVCEWRAVTSKA